MRTIATAPPTAVIGATIVSKTLTGNLVCALAVQGDVLPECATGIATVSSSPLMPDPSPPDVTVLVPALNEEDTIGEVVERLLGLPLIVQVIVIDDGSTDRTPEILRE